MNNLKRVLGLGLVGTMLAGMLTMGASAADFTDAADIEHGEAVNVLVALKIIDGKPDGSFDPEGNVTRAEMAKMIAVAMNGGNDANTGTKTSPSFTDIGGHWAESYIEYCHDLGIISGRGDGTFDPGAQVTGLEATKMVLTALGYDATAYRLTGATWAVRTDELARSAKPSLYEDLASVMMANAASRDTAAQLIWNGLQNTTRVVNPDKNTSSGETTWSYDEGKETLLEERYDAHVYVGTYEGNADSLSSVDAGCIRIKDAGVSTAPIEERTASFTFPSDMDISNIGEEVKVIWKDGKDSKNNRLDKRDVIFGVFNTGKTEVYKITKNDLQDAKSDLTKGNYGGFIKFGDALYEVARGGAVIQTNYDGTVSGQSATQIQTALKAQSVDTIKFVCDTDGRINAAYVVEYGVGRVTGISSSKITISNIGTIDIDGNDIYEGAAKDDVVTFTRFYDDSDRDEAVFTVKKAEEVEGMLTGFKSNGNVSSPVYDNVVVDGTTYKVHEKTLPAITAEDAVSKLTDSVNSTSGDAAIGDTIRLYMIGDDTKMVATVQSIETSGGKYAIVTEVSDGGSVGSNMDPLRVTVKLSDGTESTLLVHKDSTKDGSAKIKDEVGDQSDLFAGAKASSADLIEYTSITNGAIKIKKIVAMPGTAVTNSYIWDDDAKTLHFYNTETSQQDKAVAADDAVLFVGTNDIPSGQTYAPDTVVDDFHAYSIRSLGDIKNEYYQGSATRQDISVAYIKDSKGLIRAAYIVRNGRPGSTTASTLYGVVTGFVGTRQNADGDDLWRYNVYVGREENDGLVEVSVLKDTPLASGMIVRFDERADGEYERGDDIQILAGVTDGGKTAGTVSASDDTVITTAALGDNTSVQLAAIREYREGGRLLTYYSNTTRSDVQGSFSGNSSSITVDKDVVVIDIKAKDAKGDGTNNVTLFNETNGYANALLHINDKGIVDAIICDTTGDANLAKATGWKYDAKTSQFGSTAQVTLTNSASAITADSTTVGSKNGGYTVAFKDGISTADKGDDVTIVVTGTGINADNAKETIRVTYTVTGGSAATKDIDFTSASGNSVEFTVAATANVTIDSIAVQARQAK